MLLIESIAAVVNIRLDMRMTKCHERRMSVRQTCTHTLTYTHTLSLYITNSEGAHEELSMQSHDLLEIAATSTLILSII